PPPRSTHFPYTTLFRSGVDHVGIGSDFDGVGGELPQGLLTAADYPNLVAGLQAREYKDDDIRKILGGNLLRAWAAIEAGAEHVRSEEHTSELQSRENLV